MRTRPAVRKKLPSKQARPTAAQPVRPGVLRTSGVSAKGEPHRAFGKLGTTAPLAVATGRTSANATVGTRMALALPSYGPLALKVCVALWIVAVLASVFVSIKG